jgi:ABC-2 type transport system ATP-binding protein
MIVAERLSKRFGSFTAVRDVSFAVAAGEIVGFLGPNGAGKTTTMRIVAGVFPPSSGSVRVAGHDVVADSLRARAAVGYFPERVSVYLDMTVERYLAYVAAMKRCRRAAARADAHAAIAACGLDSVSDRVIGTLSKGFRQRVGIAQALTGAPRVLILDEPTAGLDPEQVAEMRALIRRLGADRTVLLSSHILSEVEAICDRVIILHRGRMLALDTPANLSRRLRASTQVHVRVRGPAMDIAPALHAVPAVTAVEVTGAEDGVVALLVSSAPDADVREALAAAVARRGWGLCELRPRTLTLEEIFLSFVGADTAPLESADEAVRDLPA